MVDNWTLTGWLATVVHLSRDSTSGPDSYSGIRQGSWGGVDDLSGHFDFQQYTRIAETYSPCR